jgi:hypothetical protein
MESEDKYKGNSVKVENCAGILEQSMGLRTEQD